MDWIEDGYYHWLCQFILFDNKHNRLLKALYSTEFTYFLAMDGNRAEDGLALRFRYEQLMEYPSGSVTGYLRNKPCSILEMMVALCLRCEESIMGDDHFGDRTSFWFVKMLQSLGLYSMNDGVFSPDRTNDILNRFLYRQYDRDGRGGLFTIDNPQIDLRSMEIWMQMNWYLSDFS